MALLLNIDTATEVASVCVSVDGIAVGFKENNQQKEHASFVHLAVKEALEEAHVNIKDVDAFSVTSGPGSYTGLRVGMATVKGFCYALSKPMITVNTLEVMVKAALERAVNKNEAELFCPMIDARRMEVFAAVYDREMNCVIEPQAFILDEKGFNDLTFQKKTLFFGSGSFKFKEMNATVNAIFEEIGYSAKDLASLAAKAFNQKIFSDISYSQPHYFKEFYSRSKS